MLHVERQALSRARHEPKIREIDVKGDVLEMEQLEQALVESGFDKRLPTAWIAEGLLEYLPVESHRRIFTKAQQMSPDGSRFLAWNGDPWCKDYTEMIHVQFPHIGLQPASDTVQELIATGWSQNVTVLDDDVLWPRYQRAMNLPTYMVSAEAGRVSYQTTRREGKSCR